MRGGSCWRGRRNRRKGQEEAIFNVLLLLPPILPRCSFASSGCRFLPGQKRTRSQESSLPILCSCRKRNVPLLFPPVFGMVGSPSFASQKGVIFRAGCTRPLTKFRDYFWSNALWGGKDHTGENYLLRLLCSHRAQSLSA